MVLLSFLLCVIICPARQSQARSSGSDKLESMEAAGTVGQFQVG